MRITVKGQNKSIRLSIPTALVFSKGSAWIVVTMGRKHAGNAFPDLSAKDMDRLFAEFRRIKQTNPDWCLVEVESTSGSCVKITL